MLKVSLKKDMERLKKKNQSETLETKSSLNQIKNIVESHSNRPEQGEDRISELKRQSRH
jgi:hypothetical protein